MKNMTRAYVYALLCVVLLGSVPAISKITMKNLDFYQLTAYSLFFATISMFCILIAQRKIKILKSYSKKDYLQMTLLGALGVYITYLLYFGGIYFAQPADAQILNNTWQIFTIIFAAILLKEKITLKKMFALLIGFFGAYIIITRGNFLSINPIYMLGYILALGSAICEGIFYILGKKAHYETWTSMTIYCFVSFILVLATTFIFSNLPIPTLTETLGLIYTGVLGIAVPYALMFRAMKIGEIAKITTIGYLSPVFALIFVSLLLKEKVFLSQIIGLFLILIAIGISQMKKDTFDVS